MDSEAGAFPAGPSEVRGRGHLHRSACQQASGHREGPLRSCGHCLEAGGQGLWRFLCRSSVGSWGGGALPERASSQGAGELHRGHCGGGGAPTPSQDHRASNPPRGSRPGLRLGENHASALCPGTALAGSLQGARLPGQKGLSTRPAAPEGGPGACPCRGPLPARSKARRRGRSAGRSALEKPQRRRYPAFFLRRVRASQVPSSPSHLRLLGQEPNKEGSPSPWVEISTLSLFWNKEP